MNPATWRIAVGILWVAVLGSSLGVVYGKQQARNRFNELQKQIVKRDNLDIEWGQLQLEQSTWATHGRVERIAIGELTMITPQPSDLRIVQP
jgi:cell division protein FtsL